MPSGQNNMDNKSDEQLLITQATIETNKKEYDEKTKNPKADLSLLTWYSWKSSMPNIGRWCSIPGAEDKGTLGFVTMYF